MIDHHGDLGGPSRPGRAGSAPRGCTDRWEADGPPVLPGVVLAARWSLRTVRTAAARSGPRRRRLAVSTETSVLDQPGRRRPRRRSGDGPGVTSPVSTRTLRGSRPRRRGCPTRSGPTRTDCSSAGRRLTASSTTPAGDLVPSIETTRMHRPGTRCRPGCCPAAVSTGRGTTTCSRRCPSGRRRSVPGRSSVRAGKSSSMASGPSLPGPAGRRQRAVARSALIDVCQTTGRRPISRPSRRPVPASDLEAVRGTDRPASRRPADPERSGSASWALTAQMPAASPRS